MEERSRLLDCYKLKTANVTFCEIWGGEKTVGDGSQLLKITQTLQYCSYLHFHALKKVCRLFFLFFFKHRECVVCRLHFSICDWKKVIHNEPETNGQIQLILSRRVLQWPGTLIWRTIPQVNGINSGPPGSIWLFQPACDLRSTHIYQQQGSGL